jgi:hypothetical protein
MIAKIKNPKVGKKSGKTAVQIRRRHRLMRRRLSPQEIEAEAIRKATNDTARDYLLKVIADENATTENRIDAAKILIGLYW